LYKYSEPNWADALTKSGSIRIGTLNDFRRIELGTERGDQYEGMVLRTVKGPAVLTPENAPHFLKIVRQAPKGWQFILGENASITAECPHPDVYVYCAADRFDERVMKEFGGAGVRIERSQFFFEAITSMLERHDENGVRGTIASRFERVRYRDREEVWPSARRHDLAFEKPVRYAHQHEVRAAWSVLIPHVAPADAEFSISPINLSIPELAKVCVRIR
jgi:hypothetical protein